MISNRFFLSQNYKQAGFLCLALILTVISVKSLYSQDQSPSDVQAESATGTSDDSSQESSRGEKNPFFPVEGMENWSHKLNVEDLDPGTYNFIVEGTDKAGNRAYSTPIDVYVDPDSDKPVVGISNPETEMVVSGGLNIIGTATDDDGVASVFVKINDGTFTAARGQEFWSLTLDTANLDDGPCTLTVFATDINGVQGDEKTVTFILNRSIPANEVISHKNGDLVHGKIKVQGTTYDGNGIKRVEMSLDGESFQEISWKRNRKESSGDFSFTLDTKDIEDGPRIIWIKSIDEIGSVGLSSFLLFIDNNPPELEILYPLEEDSMDGNFTVVGTAWDDIGLTSLSYRVGGEEPAAIPLIPGDPYWSVTLDLNDEKKADIRFTLTDLTGNEVETRLQHDFDIEGDKPVIDPVYPAADTAASEPLFAGFVSDDDGKVDVVYSVDGGEEQRITASYSFNIPLTGLSPGEHRLEYYGVDSYGRESDPVKISFSVTDRNPQLGLEYFEPLEEGDFLDFEQALEVKTETWKYLSGRVSFYNGPGTVSYSLDGSEEKKFSLKSDPSDKFEGDRVFKLPLKDIPAGYHSLLIRAVDRAGLIREETFYFAVEGEAVRGLRYADDRFDSSGDAVDSFLVMDESDSLTFYWEGDAPASAEFSAEAPFLKTVVKDSRLVLETTGPGFAGDLSITVALKSGKETVLGPFDIVSDSSDPQLALDMADDAVHGSGEMVLSGSAADNETLGKLTVQVNGGPELVLETEDGRFEEILDLDETADGPIVLTFTALDRSGRESVKYYLFRKHTALPSLRQLAPLADRGANGAVTFAGLAADPSMVETFEYSADGVEFTPLTPGSFVKTQLDLTPVDEVEKGENNLPPRSIRLTDKAGNIAFITPEVLIDTEGDKPVVVIQIPGDNSLVQDDFVVSGMAFDDDEVASLFYRIDGGEEKELSTVNSFDLPITLSDLEDNEHLLEIRAVDLNGIEGDWSSLNFRVSHSAPVSGMNEPVMGVSVRGVVDIQGGSEDPNGIEAVYISFDNGSSYDLMQITEAEVEEDAPPEDAAPEDDPENTPAEDGPENRKVSWSYSYNTNQLDDGNHSILFKGVDRYGVSGLYTSLLTIDNTPPSLEIRKPVEGLDFTGSVDLEGFINDNGELLRVAVEIQPLSDPALTKEVELPLNSLVRGSLDMSDLPAGWINLRISAEDTTGNISYISRNIRKMETLAERRVTVITPSPGSSVNGEVLVQGMAENFNSIESARLYLDGAQISEIEIKDSGFFSFSIEKDELTEGNHTISAVVNTEEGDSISSPVSGFSSSKNGPWIVLDNYTAGDYAADRPWLTGRAGYDYIVPSLEEKELKAFHKNKAVDYVEISLDNGKTYTEVKGREEWEYRLETREIPNGELWILLRAHFKDGASALSRTVVVVDKTPPEVDLLTPDEGAMFNDTALFTGTASDNNGLKSVEASLREGSKNRYQVPEFVQGLFLDFHFMGSTYAEGGVGLTFFDDNVKLEALAGYAPDGRFNGTVIGAKLIANVATLPWDFVFGYDFENFSSSLAVGTTFQYFTMQNSYDPDATGKVLGAVLAQLELVNFKNPDWKRFSSFSFYVEGQFWVISSDVEATIAPRVAFGIRTNVF